MLLGQNKVGTSCVLGLRCPLRAGWPKQRSSCGQTAPPREWRAKKLCSSSLELLRDASEEWERRTAVNSRANWQRRLSASSTSRRRPKATAPSFPPVFNYA